ncbi:hypothetical protein C0989_009543 [Termitomyces sp. Mn162]|nr:hypothetical protein C0989_009543 [Termitomyces sp. Mn162]
MESQVPINNVDSETVVPEAIHGVSTANLHPTRPRPGPAPNFKSRLPLFEKSNRSYRFWYVKIVHRLRA